MNKTKLVEKVIAALMGELDASMRAARAAHAEATHEQSRADNKYDTRGLEASYLARGQSRQIAETEEAVAHYRAMTLRNFSAQDPIDIGALVVLKGPGGSASYFVGPCAGGTEITQEKTEVLVITPQSPLGQQIMGKHQGDGLRLEIAGSRSDYKVVQVT